MRAVLESCGCFPTGRHYPGIAHLLRASTVGLVEGFAPETPWTEIEIALIDVETTGRDASIDRIVELGIAVMRGGEIVAEYNWLVNPGIPIPQASVEVHGISDADVKDKPAFGNVAQEILGALGHRVPAAYNALFDKAFVLSEFARANVDVSQSRALKRDVVWIDPLVWAREIQQAEKSRSLGEVAQRLGIDAGRAHRASDDAKTAARVLHLLGSDGRVPRPYGAFVQEQRRLAFAQADERRQWRYS
jgi:DNA polymerase-3 subunit epsilon